VQDEAWPAPDLQPLPVDLEELTDAREGDPLLCSGVIDLDAGDVWPCHLMDHLSDEEGIDWDKKVENPLVIDDLGSRRLDHAISGRGAFHYFKDTLAAHPAELESCYRFTHTGKTDRAAAWPAACGYRAVLTQGGG
jgi:hypothetical protein